MLAAWLGTHAGIPPEQAVMTDEFIRKTAVLLVLTEPEPQDTDWGREVRNHLSASGVTGPAEFTTQAFPNDLQKTHLAAYLRDLQHDAQQYLREGNQLLADLDIAA